MKVKHECPRNIEGIDMPIYSYDKGNDKMWYIQGHIIFYCPYCGIDVRKIIH